MAPTRSVGQKRRAQSVIQGDDAHTPPQRRRVSTQQQSTQRKLPSFSRSRIQASATPDDDEEAIEDDDGDCNQTNQNNEQQKHVKQLVRFAMAHEFSRQPIRRADMSKAIVGGRKLNAVFEKAQEELRNVWGMEMVELPVREKRGLHQRRTAQTNDKQTASSKSYILVSTLPSQFRIPELLSPLTETDAEYHGISYFIISLIYLNQRSVTHPQLKRYLDKAELKERHYDVEGIIKKMISQGYLAKAKDTMSGAEGDAAVEYHIGPRAKVEFGEEGLVSFVSKVFGDDKPEDLEERVKRNVGVDVGGMGDDEDGEVGAAARKVPSGTQQGRKATAKGRGKGRATQQNGDDDDDYR